MLSGGKLHTPLSLPNSLYCCRWHWLILIECFSISRQPIERELKGTVVGNTPDSGGWFTLTALIPPMLISPIKGRCLWTLSLPVSWCWSSPTIDLKWCIVLYYIILYDIILYYIILYYIKSIIFLSPPMSSHFHLLPTYSQLIKRVKLSV